MSLAEAHERATNLTLNSDMAVRLSSVIGVTPALMQRMCQS